ncbi:hypothetical protein [Acidisphaera sp. S103]|uniref:hypothetical protein n=1 Tax=Acidisphaera sp. S103 TaxID=1747223 RepID=UPI00131DBCB3|nr:hypothetical protein [Acidisphaera sp. S103]
MEHVHSLRAEIARLRKLSIMNTDAALLAEITRLIEAIEQRIRVMEAPDKT